MSIAIRLTRTGSRDVLQAGVIIETQPGAGEVWLEQEAIGVNYLDVTQRNGAVPIPLPSGLGLEAAGRVAAVGPGVTNVTVGDRVAYMLGPIGGYASGRLYPADRLVRLPDAVSAVVAATVLFKGITAHYLLHSTYPVGGLGQLMASWAKALGAFVIGVVSKDSSIDHAKASGSDAVLVWGACDLPSEVARLTSGQKAHVVYDGIGKPTFAASLDSLRTRGMMVSIGASGGAPDPIAVDTLNAKGSLFLTRPGVAAHATSVTEYRRRADAVFAAVTAGVIKSAAAKVFPLAEAAAAHAALEEGTAGGAVLLKP